MFFILSKLLLFLIKPFVWILVLCVFAYWTKRPKRRKRSLILAAVLAVFFSNGFIYTSFLKAWEIEGIKISEVEACDYGIVLSGMASFNNELNRLSLRGGGDRIWQALNLYHAGKIKKIVLSGGSGQLIDKGLRESSQLAEVLENWGIPPSDIIVEPDALNTFQNAEQTSRILKASYPNLRTGILITSGFHMRRAKACFEKQNLSLEPFSVCVSDKTQGNPLSSFIIPKVSVMSDWENLLKEMVGFVVYDCVGYL